MKRIVLIALGAAMILGTAATAMAESTAADYTVYSFEDGVRPGNLATANDKASIVDGGVFGSNKALKVELSMSTAAGWKLPIYMTEGIEYNISYYCKAGDASTLDMRPLLYIGTTSYNVTPNMTATTLTPVGNDWYYYTTKYKAGATGEGTLELRKLSVIGSNANTYFIDDVVVEPVDKTGYSNVLLAENFENVSLGGPYSNTTQYFGNIRNYTNGNLTINQDTNSAINRYVEIAGDSTSNGVNAGISSDKNMSLDISKQYKLSFSAKSCDTQTVGAKVMWILADKFYTVNRSDITLTSEWKDYSAILDFTGVSTNLTSQAIRTKLGNNKAKGGVFAFDNIKLAEVMPQAEKLELNGTPAIGEELTAAITGDAKSYLYRVYAVDSDNNAAIAANGTAVDEIKYTPTAADAGKTLKFVVTAYDTEHVYNTVETVTEAVPVPVTQTSELKFTSGLGSEIKGTAVQYTGSNAIAFLAAYDSKDRLIGITTIPVPSGIETPITLSGISAPAKAKLAMFDNKTDLNQIVQEKTIPEK